MRQQPYRAAVSADVQEVLDDAAPDSITLTAILTTTTAILTTTTFPTTALAIGLSLAITPAACDGLPGQAEAGLVPKETRE